MNSVHLIGNLTKDPELTTTPSGVSVCKFTLAVGRKFTNSDGTRETDFINIVAWRERGESCAKYLSKGKKCFVGGSLQLRNYEDNQGIKRNIVEIVADEVEFLTPRQEVETKQSAPPSKNVRQSSFEDLQPVDDGDLPF